MKSFYITKHACDVKLEEAESNSCVLTYNLQSKDPNGFSTKYNHDEKIVKASKIILIIPHFDLDITGDLSFYADILGMPKSSSYWCLWCLLSHPEWQQSATMVKNEQLNF